MKSKIIIMLTHNDRTVMNALEVFESCKDLNIDFWGFKNVGLPFKQMRELVNAMKNAGKKTFLEVVTYSEEECMAGAKMAVDLGFDYLLGTIFYQSVLDYVHKQGIKYMPFCGKVSGSPSVLEGTFDEIITYANGLLAKDGVYGIDLLAFRHKDGAGLARTYCEKISKPVVVAGSINGHERIDFIDNIKPWAFTMGSALFTKSFVPEGDFRANLQDVFDYMNSKV
jgi:hypothetical protein